MAKLVGYTRINKIIEKTNRQLLPITYFKSLQQVSFNKYLKKNTAMSKGKSIKLITGDKIKASDRTKNLYLTKH